MPGIEFTDVVKSFAAAEEALGVDESGNVDGLAVATAVDLDAHEAAVNEVHGIVSTSALVAASRFGSLVAWDTFDRPDGPLAVADSGITWASPQGTAVTENGRARIDGVTTALALLDVEVQDYDLSVRYEPIGAASGLVLRYINTGNFLVVDFSAGAVRLRKIDSGTASVLHSAANAPEAGDSSTVRCIARGDRLQVFVDGIRVIDGTLTGGDADKYTGTTVVGLRGTTSTSARFDDYTVRSA